MYRTWILILGHDKAPVHQNHILWEQYGLEANIENSNKEFVSTYWYCLSNTIQELWSPEFQGKQSNGIPMLFSKVKQESSF